MKLTFVEGDCCEPSLIDGINLIVHIVNDCGAMGSGIAAVIRLKWPDVYDAYARLFDMPAKDRATAQGQVQVVPVGKSLWVCNLFGQSGIGETCGLPAVRYGAIEEGFLRLRDRFKFRKQKEKPIHIHMGRIGSGRAGGSWAKIEEIIRRVFDDTDVSVTVYDPPGLTFNP